MNKTKSWIKAFRLRTLPLSFSSILLGNFLAIAIGAFSSLVLVLSLITTLFLQILSNLANDYGDGVKGTDSAGRIGPERAIQSGAISPEQMRRAVLLFALLSFGCGTWLSIVGTRTLPLAATLFFTVLGLMAVLAAIYYTVGKRAYGYKGLGDLFVFLFFGWTGVAGSYFLQTNVWNWDVLLPASSVGFLSMGVLNLNNMRDRESDQKAGKHTLVVLIGHRNAKRYHAFLLVGALALCLWFNLRNPASWYQYSYLVTLPLLFMNLRAVFLNKEPRLLDPLLKKLAITTLLFSLTFGIGQVI